VNRTAPASDQPSLDDARPAAAAPEPVPELSVPWIDAPPGVTSTTPREPAGPAPTPEGDHPWSSSTFWIIQLVVLALYLVRLAATVDFHLAATSVVLELSTFVLFVVPVVYAALTYGFRGALLTSGWVTLLAVPRVIVAVNDRQFDAAWAEVTQVLVLDALALLAGQHVSGERVRHRREEESRAAHLSAEALYRDLFDSNQAPILIVDGDGIVVEANASAQRSFGAVPATANRLVDVIGAGAAAQILTRLISEQVPEDPASDSAATEDRVEPVAFDIDGQVVLFRPSGTMLSRSEGGTRMQVVFEDVTAETRRHDQMEAYASRVVLGQEEERRHLAQELHDGPVQTLIHLCRQLDAVERNATLAPQGADVLADLRVIAEGTVAELRSIARGLRPSVLDDLGLVASINQLVSEAGARQQLEASFGVTGSERRLPPAVESALFRIAQEAVTNVERHAGAGRLSVGLGFEAGGLRLLVSDDGVGFPASERSTGVEGDSLGLPGMTERAHLIGAGLVIHSAPGAGTTVEVWVPATIIDAEPVPSQGYQR
jgi:PAS domain S-box-containing protein